MRSRDEATLGGVIGEVVTNVQWEDLSADTRALLIETTLEIRRMMTPRKEGNQWQPVS
jgi:hypothetical protein